MKEPSYRHFKDQEGKERKAMIKFRYVSKTFKLKEKEVVALDNVNLDIHKGDIFGVIGFSGAGKSTLIRTVNLLEAPSSGEVIVEGKSLSALRANELREAKKNIGMIFQHFNLLNSKTVFENVALPLRLSKETRRDQKKIEERVLEVLRFVGLEDKASNYPDQLSGGQKQRVGIARALVTNPSILLCDEATSALDPQTTTSILQLLKEINEKYAITILIITHEMEVIKEICNRVAVMEAGKVIETGNVFDVFAYPKTVTTKNFVKSVVRSDIPDFIFELLENDLYHNRIFQLEFLGNSAGQPVISRVAKYYNIDVNVLLGNITEIQQTTFGNLVIELIGDSKEVEKALQFMESQSVRVKEVTKGGNKQADHYQSHLGHVVHG